MLPGPSSWIWGLLRSRGRGCAWEEEGKGRRRRGRGNCRGGKGRAPKLLLNQGPSEPCYATAASVHDSPWESRSFCTVFIQVIRGRPGGLFQYTEGEEVKICFASTLLSIRVICPNRVRCRAWIISMSRGWLVGCTSLAGTKLYWYQIILLGDRGTCVLTTCPGLHSRAGWLRFEPATCSSQLLKSSTLPLRHRATQNGVGKENNFGFWSLSPLCWL